jgi:hypothetical protein
MNVSTAPVFHRFQENVFQRIAFVTEPPDLHVGLRRHAIKVPNLGLILQDELHTVCPGDRILTSQVTDRADKIPQLATRLEHQELFVGASLFFEIAVDDQPPLFQNQDLFSAFLDVAQQVR